jgi:hypothetical protein
MDILWLIADFALGFWLGARLMKAWQRYNLIATLKELGFDIDMIREVTDIINSQLADADGMIEIPITLEQHGGQLYAYRKDTSEFLAQAPDLEQLKTAVGLKLKHSVRLVIADEDGADLVR